MVLLFRWCGSEFPLAVSNRVAWLQAAPRDKRCRTNRVGAAKFL